MRKNIITGFLFILGFSSAFFITSFSSGEKTHGKKVVMIIAHQDFRDEELSEPKAILEKAGLKVVVACSKKGTATGMLGMEVAPDILVKDIALKDYDALILVGGSGATEYWNDFFVHRLSRDTVKEGKVLGAICLAPVTLANAGVLKGKKATVWSSEGGRLKAKGAVYTGSAVEADGKIITADGPQSAKSFGEALMRALR